MLEVHYDPILYVDDLCAYTTEKEYSSGRIEGTEIEILYHMPGMVRFKVHKNIDDFHAWTGIINNIIFKGRETGGTTISYTVHDMTGEEVVEEQHDLERINEEILENLAP